MCVYLRTKFEAFSIILKSFTQGGEGSSFTHPQPLKEPLKIPPRLGLKGESQNIICYRYPKHAPGRRLLLNFDVERLRTFLSEFLKI